MKKIDINSVLLAILYCDLAVDPPRVGCSHRRRSRRHAAPVWPEPPRSGVRLPRSVGCSDLMEVALLQQEPPPGGEKLVTEDPSRSPRRSWNASVHLPENLRSKAKSISSATLDPRTRHGTQSDTNDPTHANMPVLTQKGGHGSLEGLVPVVLANEHHPTFYELRSGACTVCKQMCKAFALFAVAFTIALVTTPSACGESGSGNDRLGPETCRRLVGYSQAEDSDFPAKLTPDCNTCAAAYDQTCDEGNPNTGDVGECPAGTDGFDCAVMEQTKDEINVAGAQDGTMSTSDSFVILLGLGWFIITPFVLCGAYCCCKQRCASCRFAAVPVVSDMIFEVVRSRGLAVVETTGFFLLAAAVYFDAQLCEATFALEPVGVYGVDAGGKLWPSYLSSAAIAQFRADDSYRKFGLLGLFVLRFFMGNLANNRWQDMGKNLTGAAFTCAIFFSLWSMGFLYEDVGYCRYPTAVHRDDTEISYCTIYGNGLPDEGIAFKAFMADCSAQSHLMVGAKSASQTNVSLAQLFSPTTYTPTSSLEFPVDNMANVDLLPSRQTEVERYAEQEAKLPYGDSTLADLSESWPCDYTSGTMIEAIDMYGSDCEANTRMRESTLLVSTLFILNVLELLLLLKVSRS